jgi:hypothetical protein
MSLAAMRRVIFSATFVAARADASEGDVARRGRRYAPGGRTRRPR